jgi:DNA polymerase-3 subunit delta'
MLMNQTVPSALLFTGRDGIGKRLTAVAFAMALNCTETPVVSRLMEGPQEAADMTAGGCGRCQACRRIEAGLHPDFLQVVPEGRSIRIAQIRSILDTLAMKPYEAAVRVVLIDDAHKMNPEAANALLKLLEEPPDKTSFILVAPRRNDLLPTVASRCQNVRFLPIPTDRLKEFLMAERDVPEQRAAILAALADGSYAKASVLADSNWVERRGWLAEVFSHLPDLSIVRIMAVAEQLAADRNRLEETLEMLRVWLRDSLLHGAAADLLDCPDLAGEIEAFAGRFDRSALLRKVDAVDRALASINGNGNARLAVEVMLLRLAA